jgi:hypothetical protein
MRSAWIAEWIVARFTDRKRAAAIVGDLVEVKAEKGAAWFWYAIAQVLLSLAWRRSVATIAAVYLGNRISDLLFFRLIQVHPRHPRPDLWVPIATWLILPLGTALPYAAIRYGRRDGLTRFAFAAMALVTAVIYFWWLPAIPVMCATLGTGVVGVSLCNREWRRGAAVACAASVAGLIGFILIGIFFAVLEFVLYPSLWGAGKEFSHPWLMWLPLLLPLGAAWTTTAACSYLHRRFLERRATELATEERGMS